MSATCSRTAATRRASAVATANVRRRIANHRIKEQTVRRRDPNLFPDLRIPSPTSTSTASCALWCTGRRSSELALPEISAFLPRLVPHGRCFPWHASRPMPSSVTVTPCSKHWPSPQPCSLELPAFFADCERISSPRISHLGSRTARSRQSPRVSSPFSEETLQPCVVQCRLEVVAGGQPLIDRDRGGLHPWHPQRRRQGESG